MHLVRLSFNLDKSSVSKTGLCKSPLLHNPNAFFQPCSDVEHVSPFSGKHRRILLQLLRQPMCQQHLWLGSTIFSGISRFQVLYFVHRLHTLTPFLLFPVYVTQFKRCRSKLFVSSSFSKAAIAIQLDAMVNIRRPKFRYIS